MGSWALGVVDHVASNWDVVVGAALLAPAVNKVYGLVAGLFKKD